MHKRRGDWMSTATGRRFWPLDPRPEDIDIEDIAIGLSNICRFGGHCSEFYSVAQHSVLVASLVEQGCLKPLNSQARKVVLWGLLHDASEAYLGDLIRPLKTQPEFAEYKKVERRLMETICRRFNLDADQPIEVQDIDESMLNLECAQLMKGFDKSWCNYKETMKMRDKGQTPKIIPWSPNRSRVTFIEAFNQFQTTVDKGIDH